MPTSEDVPERLNSDPKTFQTKIRLDPGIPKGPPSSPIKSFRFRFPLASKIQSIISPKKSKLTPTGTEPTARIMTSRSVWCPVDSENPDFDNMSYLAQRRLQRDQISIDALMLDSETIDASSADRVSVLSSAISVNSSSLHECDFQSRRETPSPTQVPLITIRRFVVRTYRFMDAYG